MCAVNIDGPEITMKASGTLVDLQFHGMVLDTNGRVKKADDADEPVEAPLGILQNEPLAIDRDAVIRVSGVAKAMFAATVAPGIPVTIDGDGHFIAATSADWVWGYTLETTASGSIYSILLGRGGAYTAPS